MSSTLGDEYFQRLYDESTDPWRISDGWYEQRKRSLVLAALPLARFSIGFEPGCGNGELTVLLAARCDRLVAWDIIEGAVNRTRERTGELPGVEVRTGGLPDDWPDETADLIVLSEVGYYLDETDLTRAVTEAKGRLVDGGTLLAVHWRHDAVDYPLVIVSTRSSVLKRSCVGWVATATKTCSLMCFDAVTPHRWPEFKGCCRRPAPPAGQSPDEWQGRTDAGRSAHRCRRAALAGYRPRRPGAAAPGVGG